LNFLKVKISISLVDLLEEQRNFGKKTQFPTKTLWSDYTKVLILNIIDPITIQKKILKKIS